MDHFRYRQCHAVEQDAEKNRIDSFFMVISERREVQEQALQPAHVLRFVDVAVADVLDARVRHRVDGTVLLPLMVRGFTTPEKRINSVPRLMAICFSPTTPRLPLGSSSFTVTVMVPVKVLRAAAPPAKSFYLRLRNPLCHPQPAVEFRGHRDQPHPSRSITVGTGGRAFAGAYVLLQQDGQRVAHVTRAAVFEHGLIAVVHGLPGRNSEPPVAAGAIGNGVAVVGPSTRGFCMMCAQPLSSSVLASSAAAGMCIDNIFISVSINVWPRERPERGLKLGKTLQHLVRSRDRFTVDFVGALHLNHGHQLFRHVHVRNFHVALLQRARALHAGVQLVRRAG